MIPKETRDSVLKITLKFVPCAAKNDLSHRILSKPIRLSRMFVRHRRVIVRHALMFQTSLETNIQYAGSKIL